MTRQIPKAGAGRAHVTHICPCNSRLRYFATVGRWCLGLGAVNKAVDCGPMLTARATVDDLI